MVEDVTTKIHQSLSRFPKRTYPKGQILVFAGENPEYIFYITKGKVRKYDVSYRGEEIVINTFRPPAFFPMSWALNHTANKYFYKTEEETELHIVPTNEARAFLDQNPDVTIDLLSRLYVGLEGMYGRMVHLMSGSARSRTIHELIIECRRFGHKQADGSYQLDASEADLAARSGMSRETISREISKLKDRGWLRLNGKRLVVLDMPALEHEIGETT